VAQLDIRSRPLPSDFAAQLVFFRHRKFAQQKGFVHRAKAGSANVDEVRSSIPASQAQKLSPFAADQSRKYR
jgi:hypothetical protein